MSNSPKLYADYFVEQLVSLGYTTCFFLGGGNILHLLNAARSRMKCVAVTHENSAGIAAEYFNAVHRSTPERAVAFVTAGPGVTNIMSAIGGAWLESRELLVVAGQARTEFLSRGTVRQVGHQEIDGVGMVAPITKAAIRLESPLGAEEIARLVAISRTGRKGPVFLEVCLDVAAAEMSTVSFVEPGLSPDADNVPQLAAADVVRVAENLRKSSRPMFLIGQGVSFDGFSRALDQLRRLGIPVATSWNASDYLDFDDEIYAGRPNTYGMRWANAVIQQADLLVSIGASLGVQQTGFNWQKFVPMGNIVRVDIDQAQLDRENPGAAQSILAEGNLFLSSLMDELSDCEGNETWNEWSRFVRETKEKLPIEDFPIENFTGHADPIRLVGELSDWAAKTDAIVVPCSSGGAYTTVMQAFRQKRGQVLPNNKGLASMGYGLAGAIGAAFAEPDLPVMLIEGDGGFLQNLSELGTVRANNLKLKMVIFSNGGYASIRLSQRAYFGGAYMGCDGATGLGLPDWIELFRSYDIPVAVVREGISAHADAVEVMAAPGPGVILVAIHPEQSFIPKVTSSIRADGQIESNPIHLMHPMISSELANEVFPFLPPELREPESV
jgi:acetolactate synthase-1/2/3 large subunit